MKWLDSLREKWRKGNEKERAVDEAVEKQLTPETKLAILRSKHNTKTWWWFRGKFVLIFACVVIVGLVLVEAVCTLLFGLKQYFGENVWENIVSAGQAQFKLETDIINIAIIVIAASAVIVVLYFIVCFVYESKKEQRLKKEILERLKETQ